METQTDHLFIHSTSSYLGCQAGGGGFGQNTALVRGFQYLVLSASVLRVLD